MHEKKRQRIEGTHTEGADEIVKAITEVLQQASGKEIERIAKEVGLKYVYIGNVPKEDNTICPKCEKIIIRRKYFEILENNILDGKCKFCKQLPSTNHTCVL